MPLFYQPQIQQGVSFLDVEESRHAIQVLRLREGDAIQVIDGIGTVYSAKIIRADAKKCLFEITEKKVINERKHHIHISIAPTKNIDRTEWFVEKAVEIGIEEITFMQCKNSERKHINLERIQKIAVSALKQSQRAWLPGINEMIPFKEIVKIHAEQKFIAHVDFQNTAHLKNVVRPNQSYLLLIGPEGDFADDEVNLAEQNQFIKVSLGENRLRTETAGIVGCSVLNLTQ